MDNAQLNWIANFIWGIADDVLRDVYVRGKGNAPQKLDRKDS
jgi:type I restriction enzyme M protein